MSRRERHKRRARHRGHPVKRVALMATGLAVSGIVIGVLAAVGWVVSVADSAPDLKSLTPRDPHPLSEIFAADGTVLGYIHSDTVYKHEADNQIPKTLKEATVAIEDRRFYQHGALDYQGILRAGIKDVFGGHNDVQGASTLTMQLVDNVYLPLAVKKSHNLKYKIVQAKLAEQLEGAHPKNWILDHYLNDVPYGTVGGETAIGVGAAAQVFFDKDVSQLNLGQEALLAGLPQAPSQYNPYLALHLALDRRSQVLQAMVASHYITQAQASAAKHDPLNLRSNTSYNQRPWPFLFDYIQQQLVDRYGAQTVQNGGLKVYTTINMKMQQQAQRSVDAYEGGSVLDDQPAAALATVDPATGGILDMATTAKYSQTKFDFPAQALRQPGSSAKVFALMTLIHDYHGDPNQTYYTSQYLPAGWLSSEPTWSVHTAEESYQGTINLNKATVISDNTVFAQLVVDLGIDKFEATAKAMGIPGYLLHGNPAEVIGGFQQGVTPLMMADAYATLADGGVHHPTTVLNKVVFPDGSSQNLGTSPGTRVFTDGEAYAATQVLKGVIQSGTGTAANYGCPAAGKTGTAENLANAWFVGYTPKLSTAVWVGYPQGNVPMSNGFGGTLAAPIWNAFMSSASNGYCGDFPKPSNPFYGSAFLGPHSASGGHSYGGNSSSNSSGNGFGGQTYSSPYSNPTLYAQPGGTGGAGGAGGGGGGGGTSSGSNSGTSGGGSSSGGAGLSGGGH
jgi:penicillin-binding protein 1A